MKTGTIYPRLLVFDCLDDENGSFTEQRPKNFSIDYKNRLCFKDLSSGSVDTKCNGLFKSPLASKMRSLCTYNRRLQYVPRFDPRCSFLSIWRNYLGTLVSFSGKGEIINILALDSDTFRKMSSSKGDYCCLKFQLKRYDQTHWQVSTSQTHEAVDHKRCQSSIHLIVPTFTLPDEKLDLVISVCLCRIDQRWFWHHDPFPGEHRLRQLGTVVERVVSSLLKSSEKQLDFVLSASRSRASQICGLIILDQVAKFLSTSYLPGLTMPLSLTQLLIFFQYQSLKKRKPFCFGDLDR